MTMETALMEIVSEASTALHDEGEIMHGFHKRQFGDPTA